MVYSSKTRVHKVVCAVMSDMQQCHNSIDGSSANLNHLLQVKDALGSWKDVHLASNEVAIMFGQTATQASAGLFRPATYRVVT